MKAMKEQTKERPAIEAEEMVLIRRFNGLDDWMARYDYLMLAGLALPELAPEDRTDVNRIWGCQSTVWLAAEKRNERLYLRAYSDSLIVRGLLAILVDLLDGRRCREILAWEMTFFDAMGLGQELGEERKKGMDAMLKRIMALANNNERPAGIPLC